MRNKNGKQQMIIAQVTAILAIIVMMLAFSNQASAAPGTTAHVSTSGELKAALANTAVDTIIFDQDITAKEEMKIAAKRTATDLVIDGNGHTFTERFTSAYATCYGIYLIDTTNINTITIQNMDIVGGNGYGTIYTTKGINQVFKNVNYTGPQMVYNDYGSVRIEDSTVNIGIYNGNTYNGELAEVNRVILAGDVAITKTGNDANEIFWLKNNEASIRVEEGANVTVNTNKNINICSGFVYASAKYDFNIDKNAIFNYAGKSFLEDTCSLRTFNMSNGSQFNVQLDKENKKILKASDSINIGESAIVNITVNGDSYGYILYADKNINIGANSKINIEVGKIATDAVMKSCQGDINVSENASVNIKTGPVICGYVVKAYYGSITIGKDTDFIVNSYGEMKTCLMYVKRNLTVEQDARLDLIANKNSSICCNYVLEVVGYSEKERSTITYNNPERVLFYNDNVTGKSGDIAYAAKLGCYTSIDFDVYSTEYWKSSKTTGGVNVLENADYKWAQNPVQNSNYNVIGISTSNCKQFNKLFTPTNYVGDRAMNATEYYFGKDICRKYNYEVCLWNGPKETMKLTYVFNNDYHINYDGTPYAKDESVTEDYFWTKNNTKTIKDLENVFTDYYGHTGTCEFLGWSTQSSGAPEYTAGQEINLTSTTTTLYAIWKSCDPVVNDIYEYDTNIDGIGVRGVGNVGAEIHVTLPNGLLLTTTVQANRMWSVQVPLSSLDSMTAGAQVTVIQIENNKQPSDPVKSTILSF